MSLENLSPIEQVRVSRDLHRLKRLGLHAFERFDGKEQQALDAHEEIGAYLNSRSVFERSNIESLSDDLDRPLPDQLSAYVLVPVAAGQEVATLRNTLLQYAKQDADPSTWAIMLYINSTDMGDNRITKADIEQTYQIAREFAQAYPHLTVRITGTTYMDEAPTIGHIRADMWDLALYDVYKHGLTHNNLIGISHDADSEWMSPDYIRRMQEAAVMNPRADILTCRLEWQNDGSYSSDANKILRYWQYMYAIQREKMGRFGAADANAAIRMGSYAAIEGFDRGMRLAEMIDIRDRLALARGLDFRSTEHMCFVNGIRLKTNSRRIYRAIVEGYSPDYAWDPSLPFLTGHDPVRSLDTAQLANQPLDSAVVANILHGMEHMNLIHIDTVTSQRLRQIGRKIIGLPALKF